jgi:hypothetical protein
MWSDAGSNSSIIWFMLFIAVTYCHYTKIWFVRITKCTWFCHTSRKIVWNGPIQPNQEVVFSFFFASFFRSLFFFVFPCSILSVDVLLFVSLSNEYHTPVEPWMSRIRIPPWHRLSWLSYFVAFNSVQVNCGALPKNAPWSFPFISSSLHYSLTILLFYAIIFYSWCHLWP